MACKTWCYKIWHFLLTPGNPAVTLLQNWSFSASAQLALLRPKFGRAIRRFFFLGSVSENKVFCVVHKNSLESDSCNHKSDAKVTRGPNTERALKMEINQ